MTFCAGGPRQTIGATVTVTPKALPASREIWAMV
jgi:hypothetical protein